MNIRGMIEKRNRKKVYDYFRALGYGEKAAAVLAVFDYGDKLTAAFARLFPREGRLEHMYAWLVSQDNPLFDVNPRSMLDLRLDQYIKAHFSELSEHDQTELRACFFPEEREFDPSMGMGGVVSGAALNGAMVGMSGAVTGGTPSGFPGVVLPPHPTDSYERIEEKEAKSVLTAPTSTFRMTTSTASAAILLNQVRHGRKIIPDQVRIEEVLNYFDSCFPETEKNKSADSSLKKPRFTIHTELSDKGNDRKLLLIRVEADDTPAENQNIVLLLDTSGSMEAYSSVTLETVATIVSKLKEGDVLSLVTCSDRDRTVLTNHVVGGWGDAEDLMGTFLTILIDGSTNGSAGIETAYAIGEKTYQRGWSNQVILMTDGDLNFGITSKGGLEELIEEKKKTGLFLSVIGTGLTNYMDDKLETLAKHGNGTYVVVNDLTDVKRSVNAGYAALTNIAAKDVKAQVEFNPRFVKKYRLLGFENRELIHEDFKNDAVISEPYGSGSHCVALYELTMGNAFEEPEDILRDSRLSSNDPEELGTVSVRYKLPENDTSEEVKQVIPMETSSTDRLLRARFLYSLCGALRLSDKLSSDDYKFLYDMMEGEKFRRLFDGAGSALHETKDPSVGDDLAHLISEIDRKRIDIKYRNRLFEERKLRETPESERKEAAENPSGTSKDVSFVPEERTPINDNGEWKCRICGSVTGNNGNFCVSCGAERPMDVWRCTCGNCSTGKFCSFCGKPKG